MFRHLHNDDMSSFRQVFMMICLLMVLDKVTDAVEMLKEMKSKRTRETL